MNNIWDFYHKKPVGDPVFLWLALKPVMISALLVIALLLFPVKTHAENAAGDAYAEQIDLSLSVIGIGADVGSSGPAPVVSGSGMDSFGPITGQSAGVTVDLLAGTAGVTTGLLSGSVAYDNSARTMTSTGQVDDPSVDLDVLGLVGLGLTADQIGSTSTVTGECGALQATGTTTINNGSLSVLGNSINLPSNPPPDTAIDINALGLAGVTLTLNEQTVSGNGVTGLAISTNAIRMTLNVNLVLVTLTGEIVLGHSEASVQCNTGDLQVIKTANPDPVAVGAPLTYTVSVTNTGPQTATAVTVQDSLPAAVAVNSVTPSGAGSCSQAGNTVSCTWPGIASGDSEQVLIVVTPQTVSNVNNTAIVDSDDYDPNPGDNDTAITTIVDPAPGVSADLSVSKTANPDPATMGQPLTYTVSVTNSGPDAAGSVSVQDTLPASVTVNAITPDGGGSCGQGGGVVTCNWASVTAGATVQAVIVVTPLTAGGIDNTAVVSSSDPDPDPANNTVTITTVVDPAPSLSADVGVAISAQPSPATVGEPLVHTMVISNNGPDAADNVVLDLSLPPSLSIDFIVPTMGVSCNLVAGGVNCQVPSLSAASSAQVVVESTPQEVGNVTAVAALSAATPDPDLANNSASVTTEVQVGASDGEADLAVGIEVTPEVGRLELPLFHRVTVGNQGPFAAHSVNLTIAVPPSLQVNSVTSSDFSCTQNVTPIVCSRASLNIAATAEVLIESQPDSIGTVTVTADVTALEPDPQPANNMASVSTPIINPEAGSADLGLSGTVNPNPAVVGEPITHSFTVVNGGPEIAGNTMLEVSLPESLQISLIDPMPGVACDERMNVIRCALGDLAPGDAAQLHIESTCDTAEEVVVVAMTFSDRPDPRPENNDQTLNNIVVDADDIRGTIGAPVAIPTLSPTAMLLLLCVLFVVGWYKIRKYGQNTGAEKREMR